MWGRDFTGAYLVLVVLGIGQFVNVSTGCCGMVLAMCGYEKLVGYTSFTFLCLNLVLNYFLILRWGAVGAATATAITIAGENATKMVLAKTKVGISTIPIPNF
jgi:O-antigen/teichoic acid export membrane protein